MRFLRLDIDGFGGVTGTIDFPRDRLALFVDRNEAGKSSVANALFFTLYGAPLGNKFRDEYNLINRYLPWDGKPFRCSLICESNNITYRIFREFGDEPKTKIIDFDTKEDVTDRFFPGRRDEIGERITGLTFQEALQTMFLRQAEVALDADRKSLTSTVQRIATSSTSDITVAHAIDILNKSLTTYPFPKLTKAAKIENEITRLRSEIERIAQAITERESERETCIGMLQRESAIRERLRVLDSLQSNAMVMQTQTEYERLEQEIAKSDKVERDWEECNIKITNLEPYSRIPLDLAEAIQERYTNRQMKQKELREKVDLVLQSLRTEEQKRRENLIAKHADVVTPGIRDHLRDLRNRIAEYEREIAANGVVLDQAVQKLKVLNVDPILLERTADTWSKLSPEDEAIVLSTPRQATLYLERKRHNQTQINELKTEIAEIETERDVVEKKKTKLLLILSVFLLSSIAFSYFFHSFGWIGSVVALLGVLAMFIALLRIPKSPIQYAARITLIQSRITDFEAQIVTFDTEYAELNQRLETIGSQVGVVGNKDLFEAVQQHRTALEPFHEWREKNLRKWELEAQRTNLLREVIRISEEIFRPLDNETVSVSAIEQRLQEIEGALRMQAELEEKRQERIVKESEREQVVHELESLERELSNLYRSAGVPESLPLEESIVWYRMAAERRKQWNKLKSETMPALAAQRLDAATLLAKHNRMKELRGRLQTGDKADLPDEFKGKESDQLLIQVESERKNLSGELHLLEMRLFDFQNRWSEVGALRRNRTEMEQALSNTLHFERAANLAISELTRLSDETHREWAGHLDQTATAFVEHFGGSVAFIAFAQDLSVSVRLRDGRLMTEKDIESLSVGARDQIYLAVRLAVTDFLSKDSLLPLVCDEPFAQADDIRFTAGMDVLKQVAENRQVIVLTCHESRHREWKSKQNEKISWLQVTA